MATRHNLEIAGFEAAGISVHTIQVMADAVDTVLAKYPKTLRGIEIEEGARPSRAGGRRRVYAATATGTDGRSIIFDTRITASIDPEDPEKLLERAPESSASASARNGNSSTSVMAKRPTSPIPPVMARATHQALLHPTRPTGATSHGPHTGMPPRPVASRWR